MRTRIAFLVAACLAGTSCAEDGTNTVLPDNGATDPGTGPDTAAWDPGNPSETCGGYGYGTGPDCVPDGALDCTQDPCIFGTCETVDGQGVCRCDEGYAGRICGACADGWVERGLRCVRQEGCDTYPCVFGTCRILNQQPYCDCDAGYTGANCDECADGYRAQNLRCVKEGA